jgi:hypothetical protein
MTFSEIASRIMIWLPHRAKEWGERDAGIGDYIDAGELAGYVLDEFVQGSVYAAPLGLDLERFYELADEAAKEVMRIGIFEEMCLTLHVVWDDRGRYEEARRAVLGYLGPIATEVFVRYDEELSRAEHRIKPPAAPAAKGTP